MCGRFLYQAQLSILEALLDIPNIKFDCKKNFNIAPTHDVFSLIKHNEEYRFGNFKWGLIPSWAKDEKFLSSNINARSETVHEKPTFKDSFVNRRCIIFADGYYEWSTKTLIKKPFLVQDKNKNILLLAGIWDKWINPKGEKKFSCSILTTAANKSIETIHDRMPVILDRTEIDFWLNCKSYNYNLLQQFFSSDRNSNLIYFQVSDFVNSVKNNSEKCIEEVSNTDLF
jgi:putative SOS response-associated peptidase YedK